MVPELVSEKTKTETKTETKISLCHGLKKVWYWKILAASSWSLVPSRLSLSQPLLILKHKISHRNQSMTSRSREICIFRGIQTSLEKNCYRKKSRNRSWRKFGNGIVQNFGSCHTLPTELVHNLKSWHFQVSIRDFKGSLPLQDPKRI